MSTQANPSSARQDWLIGPVIGLTMLLLGLGGWYASQRPSQADEARPKPPVWVDVGRVQPQMSDGGMANIKLDLQIDETRNQAEIKAHAPAFKSMVEERGAEMSREEMLGAEGMQRLAKAVRSDANNYLRARHYPERIRSVAFEEFHVLP
jgi:flagellar basal body-associated protein FliL